LNDCWPVSSWALVDYESRRKASFYFVKRAFAMIMLSIWPGEEEMEVSMVNDTLNPVGGTLKICLVDTCGRTIWRHEAPLSAEANGVGQILIPVSSLPESVRDGAVLSASLHSESGTVASTRALFQPLKDLCIPEAEVSISSVEPHKDDGFVVTLTAESLACYVHLASPDAELSCSDNWFHMLPGEERKIIVHACGVHISPDSIEARCLNGKLQAAPEIRDLEDEPVLL
jgi:beta-mannosidase